MDRAWTRAFEGCREDAARTGEIGLQTWSPPLPGGPESELGMGGLADRPLSPGTGAHMEACPTTGTSRCAQHLDALRSLSGFLCLSCRITYQQQADQGSAFLSAAQPRCLPLGKRRGAGDRGGGWGASEPAEEAALDSVLAPDHRDCCLDAEAGPSSVSGCTWPPHLG